MPLPWFDAHLDLAYMAECGRDMTLPLDRCGGPDLPAAVSFPSLREGRIGDCLGTIFTEADGKQFPAVAYPAGDAAAAHAAGLRQLARYQEWNRSGWIGLRPPASVGCSAPCLAILMEGADPIRTPDELDWWADQGVVAVGMAWWKPSRYAGGNGTDLGLTDLGRELTRAIDARRITHDVSHLSDRALEELFSLTDRPVMASHSNCRARMGGKNQRHLTDPAIREIARRGGVIGLNLFSKFLREGLAEDGRASIEDCVRHIEHICDLAGHRRAVGLGSDMDGGFSAARLPAGIDRPVDLEKLAAALAGRGWSAREVDAFRWGNWANFLFGASH